MSDLSNDHVLSSFGERVFGTQLADGFLNGRQVNVLIPRTGEQTLEFARSGDVCYRLMPTQDLKITIPNGVRGQFQRMTVILQQPAGGDCAVTFPGSIKWAGGKPFLDSRAGAVAILEFLSDGSSTLYGRLIHG